MSELNLTWVTVPPLRTLDEEEVEKAIKEFNESLAGWEKVPLPKSPTEEDVDQRDWKSPQRTKQKRWNQRIKKTKTMANASFGGDFVVGYYVAGRPIGLLAMGYMRSLTPHVNALVTHPGSDAAGGILIECAVNKSVEWEKDGKLKLFALTEDAREAYKALGFVGDLGPDSQLMSLDPKAREDLWAWLDGMWKLKKYVGKLYVA